MNKRGQFYLVAAVLIILVLIGITGLKTYAVARSEPETVYDLSSELNEETARIVDYGVYNNDNKIEDFLSNEYKDYFLKKTQNTSIIFVYGNETEIYEGNYSETSIGSIFAAGSNWNTRQRNFKKSKIYPKNGKVNVKIFKDNYEFKIKKNEVFYFLIVQEKDGEKYVARN